MKKSSYHVVPRKIDELKPYSRNARTHSKRQIRQIADSIERFGFTNPVLVSGEDEIVAGHGRIEAARLLGWCEVPTLELSHLSPEERRAYVIADNKLAENAGWDPDILAIELEALIELDFDVSLTGFSMAEVDLVLDQARERGVNDSVSHADAVPEPAGPVVTRRGDVWVLGRHRLVCGDAREGDTYSALLGDEAANVMFTDPPYNVHIDGHVSGLGRVHHREFAMASGEMSEAQFTEFLTLTLGNAASYCGDGAIAFVCMDWRHIGELLRAGRTVFTQLKNICVWNKTNGGMGAFYRSKHELILVFKKGTAPHINNFELGQDGRYRTNVWDYPGINSFGATRDAELEMHPTVKPAALIADALRDCSKRGHLVLDPFAGSGSTLIAAETCGRTARLIELDPAYCDTIVRRFTAFTGKVGRLADGRTFDDISEERCIEEVRS